MWWRVVVLAVVALVGTDAARVGGAVPAAVPGRVTLAAINQKNGTEMLALAKNMVASAHVGVDPSIAIRNGTLDSSVLIGNGTLDSSVLGNGTVELTEAKTGACMKDEAKKRAIRAMKRVFGDDYLRLDDKGYVKSDVLAKSIMDEYHCEHSLDAEVEAIETFIASAEKVQAEEYKKYVGSLEKEVGDVVNDLIDSGPKGASPKLDGAEGAEKPSDKPVAKEGGGGGHPKHTQDRVNDEEPKSDNPFDSEMLTIFDNHEDEARSARRPIEIEKPELIEDETSRVLGGEAFRYWYWATQLVRDATEKPEDTWMTREHMSYECFRSIIYDHGLAPVKTDGQYGIMEALGEILGTSKESVRQDLTQFLHGLRLPVHVKSGVFHMACNYLQKTECTPAHALMTSTTPGDLKDEECERALDLYTRECLDKEYKFNMWVIAQMYKIRLYEYSCSRDLDLAKVIKIIVPELGNAMGEVRLLATNDRSGDKIMLLADVVLHEDKRTMRDEVYHGLKMERSNRNLSTQMDMGWFQVLESINYYFDRALKDQHMVMYEAYRFAQEIISVENSKSKSDGLARTRDTDGIVRRHIARAEVEVHARFQRIQYRMDTLAMFRACWLAVIPDILLQIGNDEDDPIVVPDLRWKLFKLGRFSRDDVLDARAILEGLHRADREHLQMIIWKKYGWDVAESDIEDRIKDSVPKMEDILKKSRASNIEKLSSELPPTIIISDVDNPERGRTVLTYDPLTEQSVVKDIMNPEEYEAVQFKAMRSMLSLPSSVYLVPVEPRKRVLPEMPEMKVSRVKGLGFLLAVSTALAYEPSILPSHNGKTSVYERARQIKKDWLQVQLNKGGAHQVQLAMRGGIDAKEIMSMGKDDILKKIMDNDEFAFTTTDRYDIASVVEHNIVLISDNNRRWDYQAQPQQDRSVQIAVITDSAGQNPRWYACIPGMYYSVNGAISVIKLNKVAIGDSDISTLNGMLDSPLFSGETSGSPVKRPHTPSPSSPSPVKPQPYPKPAPISTQVQTYGPTVVTPMPVRNRNLSGEDFTSAKPGKMLRISEDSAFKARSRGDTTSMPSRLKPPLFEHRASESRPDSTPEEMNSVDADSRGHDSAELGRQKRNRDPSGTSGKEPIEARDDNNGAESDVEPSTENPRKRFRRRFKRSDAFDDDDSGDLADPTKKPHERPVAYRDPSTHPFQEVSATSPDEPLTSPPHKRLGSFYGFGDDFVNPYRHDPSNLRVPATVPEGDYSDDDMSHDDYDMPAGGNPGGLDLESSISSLHLDGPYEPPSWMGVRPSSPPPLHTDSDGYEYSVDGEIEGILGRDDEHPNREDERDTQGLSAMRSQSNGSGGGGSSGAMHKAKLRRPESLTPLDHFSVEKMNPEFKRPKSTTPLKGPSLQRTSSLDGGMEQAVANHIPDTVYYGEKGEVMGTLSGAKRKSGQLDHDSNDNRPLVPGMRSEPGPVLIRPKPRKAVVVPGDAGATPPKHDTPDH